MHFIFITISSFAGLPPVKNYTDLFSKFGSLSIFQIKINVLDNEFLNKHNCINIIKFKDLQSFLKQSFFQKIYKYLFVLVAFVYICVKVCFYKQRTTLYVTDLYCLYLSCIFKNRYMTIVYHQFELLEPNDLNFLDLFIFKRMSNLSKKIDLAILPEVNRYNFLEHAWDGINHDNTLVIPNTNDNLCHRIKSHKRVVTITHIGSLGQTHHVDSFIKSIRDLKDWPFNFLFVGNVDSKIAERISVLNNVTLVPQVHHSELENIYLNTDLGIILYKNNDLNSNFCAPNKLYEYWSYGVPVLGDLLKGLVDLNFSPIMGDLIDLSSSDQIKRIILSRTECFDSDAVLSEFQEKFAFKNFVNSIIKKLELI